MSTSGTFTFTVTQNDIVRDMMLNVGALGENEVPTAQEFIDCSRKLNMMVKQWMGRQDFAPGLKMWTRQRGNLFLGYSKHLYLLGPTGDNWAGGVTGGTPYQLHNMTTTTAVTSIGTNVLNVSSTALINVNDYIGVVYTPQSIQGGGPGPDIFWSTVQSVNSVNLTVTMTTNVTGLVANGSSVYNYTVKQQRPLEVVTCLLRDSQNNDTPQNFLTVQEYESLPTKTMPGTQGDPTAFYYESQIGTGPNTLVTSPVQGNGVYYIDCFGAQDVTKFIHMVFLRPVMDIVNGGDNVEYPQQWYRALGWGGAKDIAAMFDCPWTQDMEQNYQDSIAMAKEADSEVTRIYFQRESDQFYGT
jgi:hypothetical protein